MFWNIRKEISRILNSSNTKWIINKILNWLRKIKSNRFLLIIITKIREYNWAVKQRVIADLKGK